MDENRAQAYLDLIQQLLTCPNGAEPQILQANSELLDSNFLQVCEEVATMFAAQGEENLALFLRNLASTFGESLGINQSEDRPESIQEYLQFIQDLFQAEDESDSDIAVVYPILDGRRQLLNARFAEVLQQVVEHYIAEQPEGTREIIGIIENLSIDIYNFPRGNRANNLEVAIAGYQIVLSHREPGSEKWAQTQNNLAAAYSDRIRGERADNLEQAIASYQSALKVLTREAFPEKWAGTQNNLANAYSDRIRGERADNLEGAIASYQSALEVLTREAFPEKWAMTQNNLANAYRNRIRGERADNLEGAIACFQSALEVRTRDAFPEDWAMTQNNLAAAYSDRIRGERADNLEGAIACYHRALEVRTRDAFPEDWADTQNNLGEAYRNRIRGERADNLEGAIACYHRALEVRTRDAFPQDWAGTQNNLANAYFNRIRGERADNLEQAIASYQSALEVRTRDAFPQDWAMTQNNLAAAYSDRIRGERADNLEGAIACYHRALEVRTRDAFPEDWADTQNNLGEAYRNRIRGERADNLEGAIACYHRALEVYTRDAFPEDWAMTQNNLANAYSDRIRGERADNLEQAIAYYHRALEVYTRDAFPQDWAMTQNNLANAYSDRIRGERADNLEQAIACYHCALEVYTREAFPKNWATTQNNLAIAYSGRIRGERADNFEQAIEAYQAALTIRTPDAFPQENVETLNNLGWTYLAQLETFHLPPDDALRATTLQNAYHTFQAAIAGAENLRQLIKSGDEIKQKHDLQWDRLYEGMVQICLDLHNPQAALEYAEANKARNLAELIAQKQPNSQPLQGITYQQITQLLTTPDTALIEWYITNKEIIAFVLTFPDQLTVHRRRQWDEITDLVNQYRQDYQNKDNWRTQLPTYLQRLADILDIATILPPDCQRAILIPHWFLHLFPLHALPLSDGEFLLDRFPQGIQYAPSCQLLQQIQIQPNFEQLLALQNPTADLKFTDIEVTSIAPKFPISQILPGKEASKTNLLEQYLQQLQTAHCAHFSCHGFFDPNAPLRSALILSGGIIPAPESSDTNRSPLAPLQKGGIEELLQVPLFKGDLGGSTSSDTKKSPLAPLQKGGIGETLEVPLFKGDLGGSDRYVAWRKGQTADITKCLTLADILQLQLPNCRLAVLSACETALIDTSNRSDYIGLPTGFLHAGAMGIIASLWAVNDISTALIVVKFYELLAPGISIGIALHHTQRWFKSAPTTDLLNWVQDSPSFNTEQKKDISKQLNGYNPDEKPYSDIYHWAAFCAIGL